MNSLKSRSLCKIDRTNRHSSKSQSSKNDDNHVSEASSFNEEQYTACVTQQKQEINDYLELTQLVGINIDPEILDIILELLKHGVNPYSLYEVLSKLSKCKNKPKKSLCDIQKSAEDFIIKMKRSQYRKITNNIKSFFNESKDN